jgi:hypothetical protein
MTENPASLLSRLAVLLHSIRDTPIGITPGRLLRGRSWRRLHQLEPVSETPVKRGEFRLTIKHNSQYPTLRILVGGKYVMWYLNFAKGV